MVITRKELIKKYTEFFKSKSHKEIPNSSLIPENDPTVLFTTAGMHPIVPYLLGQPHPLGKRLVNVQRCIRTGDIDEVGDTYHHTFFEMLGNWSLGDYFKEEAIKMTFEFQTKFLKIPLERYAVTCFAGKNKIPKDEESEKVWLSLGVSKDRIAFLGEDNFWQLPGAGPCGPCTEQFYWKPNDVKAPKKFDPTDNRWVEIGNDVLMQYVKDEKGNYSPAKQKNIDFGGGVERTLAVLNGYDDNYLTEIWQPIIKELETLSGREYKRNSNNEELSAFRIIADHIKASVFLIGDERSVKPSNTGQGYVLRRLIRRAVRYGRKLGITENFTEKLVKSILEIYDDYEILQKNKKMIISELKQEEEKFSRTLEQGEKELMKLMNENKKVIDGKTAFLLYQSFGFPLELIIEAARQYNIKVDEKEFENENKKHQELSRSTSAGTFKSGLADNSQQTTKLHTATHLLNEALRIVLKDENIHQKGSNITPERLRFDFNFPRKLEEKEIKAVEDLINKKIKEELEVKREEMSREKALKVAHGEFGAKYPDIVSVYTIKDFSKEICTGPHINNLKALGHFKIIKEESVGTGVRRIKATLE